MDFVSDLSLESEIVRLRYRLIWFRLIKRFWHQDNIICLDVPLKYQIHWRLFLRLLMINFELDFLLYIFLEHYKLPYDLYQWLVLVLCLLYNKWLVLMDFEFLLHYLLLEEYILLSLDYI